MLFFFSWELDRIYKKKILKKLKGEYIIYIYTNYIITIKKVYNKMYDGD